MEALSCPWDPSVFLIFSSSVPALLYYTYIPVIILSLAFSVMVLVKDKYSLLSRLLFLVSLSFCCWVLNVLVQWASNAVVVQMLAWQLTVFFEIAIFLFSFYFAIVFFEQKDASSPFKWVLFLIFLPVLAFLPTSFNISSFYLTPDDCGGNNGSLWSYAYVVEIGVLVWVLFLGLRKSLTKGIEPGFRKQVLLLTIGLVTFLSIFFVSNYLGELTQVYTINLVGPAGMVLFLSLMAYLIVKFKLFHMKIIGASALMIAVWVLIASLLAIQDIDIAHAVIASTLIPVTVLGWMLINSVRKEVALREELEVANAGQADLLHIINHQIKGYMTKARYAFDDLLEDKSYGLSEKAIPVVKQGYDSVTEGVNFVQDFLNASNIEKGTFTYTMAPMEFDGPVRDEAAEQKEVAEKKGLKFEVDIQAGDYRMTGDKAQLTQAVRNLIDNSIKYTPSGSLTVSLERKLKSILFTVSDTGVGLSDDVKPKLFTKGGRDKNSQKINVNSTGFGLAFVKGVASAHSGRVWAESPGPGKGSTFYLELPVV